MKLAISRKLPVMIFFLLVAAFGAINDCRAQIASSSGQTDLGSTTKDLTPSEFKKPANIASTGQTATELSQNQDSMTLQEKISVFNKRYCPPQSPITEINDFALAKLVNVQLIKRSDLDKYRKMVIVNGKVYVEKEKGKDEPKPEPMGKAGKNLFGDLKLACEQLEQKKTRGQSDGNQKPKQILELKRRKITYRDRDNQLREMEIYSPPKFPAKKKAIAGKRGKTVKDYATSLLVPKNPQGKTSEQNAFDDMPSADAWLDDDDVKTQK
ncbi:MAG TPA: hypothetical protein PLM07_07745 [Candidatus Rifleibacterium sp.]|nr:hypothetical protein [Candidatus Rifleibacterium sp.]HPT45778.1 hypothetical protein [Candidatus Rifleibacterium sp.]